jgi:hypothetical protein
MQYHTNWQYFCTFEFEIRGIIKFVLKKILLFFGLFIILSEIQAQQVRPDEVIVNYTCYKRPMKLVLQELRDVSKVNITYSESKMPITKLVSITAKQEKLGSVLQVILDDFGFTYQIVGNQLVLLKADNKNVTGDVKIYGYIKDKHSGENLIGANIFLFDKSRGTNTNENGFYSLQVSKDNQRIHFSYLGYKALIKDIYSLKDTMMNISLEPDGLLNEIIILDDLLEEEQEQPSSHQSLHIDKIQASTHLAGEPDVFRYISSLPGVNTASDGIGGLNIRGGSSDQNLVLLDGIPLYNASHALGIFSVFNSNAIKNTTVYKGGIPARYSGRLSSIIDIHTKDGNVNKWSGEATLSTIAFKTSIEGPIIKEKGSMIFSYRRTFMDVWIKELTKFQNKGKNKEGSANYFFHDFNFKIGFKVGKSNTISAQILRSLDDFKNDESTPIGQLREVTNRSLFWNNQLYSFKFNSQIGKDLFSKFTIYRTGYSFDSFKNSLFDIKQNNDTTAIFDASLYISSITETGAMQEFDYLLSPVHTIKAGVQYHHRIFGPGLKTVNEKDFNPPVSIVTKDLLKDNLNLADIKGGEINFFAEDLIKLGDGVSVNAGLNYSMMTGGYKANSVEPRLAFLAESEQVHFKVGVSKMHQFMHLLSNNGLGFPNDIWLPVTNVLPAQKSWIFNAAFGMRYNSGFRYGAEVYYKIFDNITSFREGAGQEINGIIDRQAEIPIGKGNAYGLETYFEKVTGKTLFNINYTYSISDRLFDDLNLGRDFPYGLNRNHSLKTSFTYRLSEFSEFLINWSYMSGNYYSRPINVTIDIDGRPVVIFEEKNNQRFPPFHRMDVGFSFYNIYKWGKAKFFIGLYNAYNRNNPFYTELVRNKTDNSRFEFKQFSLLPLLPSLSYSISF